MTRQEIYERIVDTMSKLFELDREQISWESKLEEDLSLDSIDAVDMAVKLQDLTGKKMPLSDLTAIRTVADVVDAIEKHVTSVPDAEGEPNKLK